MPQFDFYSFPGQTFWFLHIFLIFYFFTTYFYAAFFSEKIKITKTIAFLSTQLIIEQFIRITKFKNIFELSYYKISLS